MEQKFIIAVSEHRSFGFLILPFIAEAIPDRNYFSVVQRLRIHDLSESHFPFTPLQIQLVKLTEKYADDVLAKKFYKKGTLNDFYKNVKTEELGLKLNPFIDEIMVKCLDLLKSGEVPVYFKRAKYTNLYDEDLITLCYEDTSTVFNFHRLENETQYFLTIRNGDQQLSLLHRNITLLVNEPCRILYQNKLYFFDDISGSKLQPFFDKEYISIPKKVEEKYFGSFILNAVKSQEVNFSGFEIIDLAANKEAILSVENDLAGYPVFVPVFKYNNKSIGAGEEGKKVVSFEVIGGNFIFHRFEKDHKWESALILKLRELELEGENHAMHLTGYNFENRDNALYRAIGWLAKNSDRLKEVGFVINQDRLDHAYYIGSQSLELKINQSIDWFDLYATVKFGQFSFPFIRLRKNILNQIREFKLPDGEIAILPEEWFAKYRNIFLFGKIGEQSIRVQNFHFTLISEISDDINSTIKNRLDALTGKKIEKQDLPKGLCAELRNYQKDGFNWLDHLYTHRMGGCLADDMGLGKTIQTLTLLLKYKRKEQDLPVFRHKESGQLSLFVQEEPEVEPRQPASLIVLPVSLVHNWEREIQKFTPSLRVYVYSGAARRGKNAFEDVVANYDIILTTYGIVRSDAEELSQYNFFFLILDESQNIKNAESKTYQTVTAIQSQHRIVLTGTPIENSLSDLWAQMNFLNRGLLGSRNYFKQEYLVPIERDKSPDAIANLQKLIHPFILRRTKEEVAKDLPSLLEETILVEMTPEQAEYYETEKSAARNLLLNNFRDVGFKKSTFYILQILTQLRQIAIHPKLLNPELALESGKFNDIMTMLSILVAENHKILVFSSFVKHLRLLASAFEKELWQYSMLIGQTIDRKQVIDEFQENPEKKIFLISLKAGGTGLNLTAADYIFITDPWWNPAAETQAISRAHRIGQDKKVFVYRFISENSIEEKIQRLQAKKAKLANEFVNSNDPFRDITKEDVLGLFD